MNTNWISHVRLATVVSFCWMLATTQAFGQVVINEIDYDQPSNDYFEFIELKNNGVSAVSLDTFYLELYNGGNESVYDLIDLPDSVLAPGAYFVICGDADSVTTCDFATGTSTNLIQNGGPDAVALFHAASDTISLPVTATDTFDYLLAGTIADPIGEVSRGETYVFNLNTPGQPFWIKTAATTGTGDQYNDGVTNNGTAVGTITFTVPFDAPDTLYYQSENSTEMGNIFVITNDYDDAVSYDGSVVNDNFVEGTGFAGSDPTGAGDDFKGISRFPDGADTDDNDTDFAVACITPGAANVSTSTGCTDPYQSQICAAPDSAYFQGITSDGVTIYWEAANGSNIGYLLEGDVEGFTPVGDYEVLTDTFFVVPSGLDSLTSNTTFDIYLREICAVGDTSPLSGPYKFTTLVENDSCLNALPITCGVSTYTGSTTNATENDEPAFCGTGNTAPGVWYVFSGNGDSLVVDLCGSPYDTRINVYSGSCGSLTCIVGEDDDFTNCGADDPSVGFNTQTGTDYYVYVTGFSGATGDYTLNVQCITPPSCQSPTSLIASNVTTSSATVSWTSAGTNAVSYIIEYDTSGFTLGDGIVSTTTDTFLSLSSLNTNTEFDFYVTQVCGANPGDTSSTVGPESFQTLCSTFAFPFLEDFESGSASLSCWTQSGIGAGWLTTTSRSNSGSQSYFHDDDSGVQADTLFSPSIDLTGSVSPELSFFENGNFVGSTDVHEVLISSDGGSTWSLLYSLDATEDTWTEVVLDVSGFAGQTIQVAFYYEGNFSDEWYLDDFELREAPTCADPSALASQDVTENSATLFWTAGNGAQSFIVEYDTAGFTLGDGTLVATNDTFALLSSLDGNTEFDFYVSQVCGTNPGDTTSAIGPESFSTLCSTFAFPFLEDFESGSSSLSCWTQSGIGAGWLTTTSRSNSGSQSYFHDDDSGVQADTLFSPSIDLTGSVSPELSFFENGNFVGSTDVHEVLISSDGGSTWSLLYSLDATEDTWTEVVLDVSGFAGQTIQVAFYYEGNFSDEWYLDDFELREAPTCADPSALASQDVTENSATLFWTAGNGAQSFIVEYDTAGFTPGDGNLIATNDTFALLSSLDGNTEFDFYVSQVCGTNPGDTTAAIGPESFSTLCSTFAFPFLEDFESGSASLSCWTQNGIGAGWLTTTSRSNSGSQSYFHDDNSGAQADTLFSPSIDLTGSVSPELSFFENGNFVGSTDVHEVLISSDGGATWSLLYSLDATEDTWTEVILDVSGFAGQTIQVAFYYEGNFSDEWYLDDFELREAPTCADPSALASQDVTENSATLFWTAGNGSQSFIVEYDTAGFTPGDGNLVATSDTFALLSSLDVNTDYDFYVSQVCGTNPGDTTAAIGPESFTTACGVIAAPYLENFDGTNWLSGTGFSNTGDAIAPCWSRNPLTSSDFFWGTRTGSTGSSSTGPDADNTTGSGNYLFTEGSNGSTGDFADLFTPQIDLSPLTTPQLLFAYHFYGSDIDSFDVSVNAGLGWVSIDTVVGAQQGDELDPWLIRELDLSSFASSTIQVRFRAYKGGSFADYAIDDFWIRETPSCIAPSNLTSQDITAREANVNWVTGGGAISYIVEYDTAGFSLGTGNVLTTTDTFVDLSSLVPLTDYDVYVTQVCGTNPGDTSFVTGPESFTTLVACDVPTALASQNITQSDAVVSWTSASGSASFIVEYDTAGFTSGTGTIATTADTFLTLSSLSAGTAYDFYVVQVCGTLVGDSSLTVGPGSFSTLCAPFLAPFTENFDGADWITGTGFSNTGDAIDPCWSRNPLTSSDFFWGTRTGSTGSGSTGPDADNTTGSGNYVFTEASNGSTGDFADLFTPQIDLSPLTTPQLLFAYHFYGSGIDSFDVSVNAGLGWVSIDTIVGAQQGDELDPWLIRELDLSAFAGNAIQVRFRGYKGGSFADYAIDDVVIRETPLCDEPSLLSSQDITENSATVSWTGGSGAVSYIVEYDTAGFTLGDGDFMTTTDTFVNLSGLVSATEYDFYVTQVCGTNPGDTSVVSGSASFTTACGVFAFPFLDDLEAGSSSLSCWTQNGIGAGWLTTTARSNSGNQSYFHNDDSGAQADTLFSPRVDLSTAIDPELSFFENGNFVSFADSHQVIISIDGGLTWDLLYTDLPVEDEWNEVIIDLSAYVGQTVTVGFYYQGDFSDDWYIDDFELRETPQCPPVTALTATNITQTSATLSWTPGTGNDTTYIVGYDEAGTPLNALGNFTTTTDTFLNITGLMGSTAYDFYVAGICGENPGDTTLVGPSTFNTPIANDDCSGALALCTGDTLTNQLATGATQSLPGVTCNGFTGTADDDVWYKFIARSTNPRIVLVGATGYDAVLELLSGSCGSTTNLDCADNTFGGGTEIINAVGLTVGEVYYVRAYDWSTGIPTGSFDIFIEDASFATVTPERDTVCVGGTATFTASGGDTYLWGSGETTASITTPAVTSLTEFIVTVTDSFGCSSVDTAIADVYPAPAVSAGMNDTICLGDTTTLTATGSGTFLWSTNESTASIDVSPSVTTEYVVTLTGSANGCTNTDTVLVVIDTLPAAVLPDTALVCTGSNVTLDAGNSGSSYLWNTSAITQSITVASGDVGLYTVEITNSQGCVTNDTSLVELTASVPVSLQDYTICEGDTQVLDAGNPGKDFLWSTGETTQTIDVTMAGLYDVTVTDPLAGCSGVDTSIITVNPAPPADAGSDETICEGDDVTLTATGGDSYAWTSGDNTASTTVSPIVTTDYIVTVTENVNNCSATDTVTVNVNPAPLADAGTNDTICVGETSTFTATGGDSYSWSTGSSFDTTIVTPLTTTEYVVTVTENVNNCSATDTVLSVVNPLPNADAGFNDTICLGESSTLTATGGVDYSWSSGDNTASSIVTPVVDTEYIVTVIDANGCVNTDTVDVVVNGLPTADAGADDTICEGETTTLTASGGVSYSWSSGDNTAATDVSPVTDTEFIVTVTDVNGCTDTDTADVFVNAAPPADAGMNDTICVGESSTFTATGGDSYAWSSGDNLASTTVSPLTTTEYVVTVTENVNNCTATDTVLSVVNPLPNADAGSNDTICLGESSTLTASGGVVYSWSSGDNAASTTVTPSADTEYIVTVTDANGCVNTDTADVVVNALPVADAGADQTVCIGSSTTLTAAGGTDYEWSNGDLTASTSVAPSTATEYSVTVTDANACSDADTVEVFVNPLPTAAAGVDTNVCEGSSITLTASGGTAYVWSSGDSTSSASVSPSVDSEYVVTVTDGNGCSDTDTVFVEVLELPIVRFVQVDSVYCIGVGNVQLVASPPGGIFSGTGVSGTDLDLTAVGSGNTTTVTFTYEALNGCENSTSLDVLVDPCTGIDEIDFLNQVQLMPNPFRDRLVMTFNSDKESKVMLTMTDVSGKQVWAENKQILSGRNTFEISSGAQLAEGMYFITISNADNSMTYKVIKSK